MVKQHAEYSRAGREGEGQGETVSRSTTEGRGTIMNWNDKRGFGFIKPADPAPTAGSNIFVHISEVRLGIAPGVGAAVRYRLAFNVANGKFAAQDVTDSASTSVEPSWKSDKGPARPASDHGLVASSSGGGLGSSHGGGEVRAACDSRMRMHAW